MPFLSCKIGLLMLYLYIITVYTQQNLEKETEISATMENFLIVGLGNPGKEYYATRHNAGWLALDYIAEQLQVKIKKIKFKATYAEAVCNGKKLILLKPQTYMNASGESVMAAADYYHISPENILVIHDDISLPSNKLRIRKKGSAGGHNGLKSIIYLLNSDEFPRIKIGVADRRDSSDLKDWVLGTFSKEEQKGLLEKFESIYDAAMLITEGKIEQAMAKYNGD